jgi:hypothetical protein
MAKRKKITATDILTFYMNYEVENGSQPYSVDEFAKDHNFEEAIFYEFYASFKKLEQHIFKTFFDNTITALQKSEEYATFDARNKLLSFYYTFFENLTANRAYVVVALKSNKKSLKPLKKLSKLKHNFESYINSLEIEKIDFNQEAIEKLQATALKKAAWFQFLTILKFWLEDTSNSFEKTDIFIEKSINTSFDLIDTKVLKSVLDLGKFIFKEKKHFKL